ncbi:MAG: alkaline phosphatase D family protein [Deltaproteobacteria bacterium]|nr:alkaline phosphatase D family protein [Deltaproteobacteria bacterium]
MKLTRRDLLKAASTATAATAVGCGPELGLEGDGGDGGDNRDAQSMASLDAGPDAEFDAQGSDATDGDTASDAATDTRGDTHEDASPDAGTPAINPDFRTIPERLTMFPYAVMAGDATDTSVMFWTRYTGTAPITLRVLEMSGTTLAAVRFDAVVTPAAGGFVRAIVNGLHANRVHKYAFLVGPIEAPIGRSAIGTVQTAFAPDTLAAITFAGTSCSHQNAAPHPVLAHAGTRTDLDFFIHLGDHIYADAGADAVTLTEYRAKYATSWDTPGMRALHASTGTYLTWDDHEVLNNYDPETLSPARIDTARQAFFEHRATRRDSANPSRIWRKFRWGLTAEIFILDCRAERRPSTASTDPSRASTYISRTQMDWLKSGIRDSPCVFKFIMNSVPIVNRLGGDSDNWNGYASQRREILDHIVSNRLNGVLWLSGDVHFGGVCKVEAAGVWSNVWEVLMGPSGSVRVGNPILTASQWPVRVLDNIQTYTVVRANPMTRTVEVEFINGSGARVPNSLWTHTF